MGKNLTIFAIFLQSVWLSAADSGVRTVFSMEKAAVCFFALLSLALFIALIVQHRLNRKRSALRENDASVMIQHAARQDSFFNMVLGNIPCQVFIKDPLDKFRYRIANRNFVEYYQLRDEDVLEHPDEDIFDPEVARQLRSHDQEVCASPGKVFRFDEDISLHRRGKEAFKTLKVCFKTGDGHPYVLGICVEVTDFVRSAERLQKTQDLLNQVINALPVNIFAKNADDDFRYTIANRTFAEFVGRTPEEIIGRKDSELFRHPEDRDLFLKWDLQVMEKQKSCSLTEHPFDCHGVQHHLRTVKMATDAPDGHRLLLGLSLDITDLNNMIGMERINNEALSQAVAESDFRKVVEKSSKTLRTELNCSRIIFLTYSPGEKLKLFHEECSDDLPSVRESGLANHEMLWNAHLDRLRPNELILYEDFSKIPGIQSLTREHPDYPAKSLAAVPIFVGEKLLGGLLISYNIPHVFQKMDKELLFSISKIICLAAIRDQQSRCMRQAEEENQALLDNISIPLWLYDSNGRIIQTNKASDRLFGRPDRHDPYSCRKLLFCEEHKVVCPVRKALETQTTNHERCQYQGRAYLVESNPIQDQTTGAVHGVVSSFYDVTDLDAAISSRQSINECLTNLVREDDMTLAMEKSIRGICEYLKATRCCIVQFDTEKKTVSCYLEYAAGEFIVKKEIQNIPYSEEADWENVFMKTPLLSFPDHASLINCDGLKYYRESFEKYSIQSIYAHRILLNGKLWGYVSALYEQTPHELSASEKDFIGSIGYCIELMLIRKLHQNKILDALRQVQSADKAKSMFLASMSHEIRTPLNAVIGFSELLKDGTLPKQTETEYLEAISDAGNALLALINDVLDLSKLEAGQMVFTHTQVEFPSLIRSVGNIFRQKCQEKSLALNLNVPEDMPAVWIDKLRVHQILFNLLGNAVKFTDSGSISVRTEFKKCTEKTGTLSFSVEDSGIGITEEDQNRIFQMFVQASAVRGTQAEHHGTGLGLAICNRMIEKMNGKLHVESTPGKGSKFTVELCDVPWRKSARQDVVPKTKTEVESFGSMTILIADDVAMNRKVMTAMLMRLGPGVRVLNAHNADEAWRMLAANPVDFFLTDLWMPGMNGAELAAKIRRSGRYRNMIIAAVTADVESGNGFDMSVFDAILTKPVTIEKLRHLIGKYRLSTNSKTGCKK